MSENGFNAFDDVADYRYNPFSAAFTPNPIGYSGNPAERKDIPAVGPFWIHLDELPRLDSPSTLIVKDAVTAVPFTEVSRATPPAAGQFRAIYGGDGVTPSGEPGQGILEFHSSDAGTTVDIQYYGLGTIAQRTTWDRVFNDPIEALNTQAGNWVLTGGTVAAQGTPNMSIAVAAGEAIVAQKKVTWRAQDSAAITAPAANPRIDLIIVDADGDVLHLAGVEAADPVMPAVLASQRPLAYLKMYVGQTAIQAADIVQIPDQGVMARFKSGVSRWYFSINAALASLVAQDRILEVFPGDYFEEVDIAGGGDDVDLRFHRGAVIKRHAPTVYCLRGIRVAPFLKRVRISGATLDGNGKGGALELARFEVVDGLDLEGIRGLDGADGVYHNFIRIKGCRNVHMRDCRMEGYAGIVSGRKWIETSRGVVDDQDPMDFLFARASVAFTSGTTPSNFRSVCELNATEIVEAEAGAGVFQVYRRGFAGWAAVGTPLTIGGANLIHMSRFDENKLVVSYNLGGSDYLAFFIWNGATLAPVGGMTTAIGTTNNSIAVVVNDQMAGTPTGRVAVASLGSTNLTMYTFTLGGPFTPIGTPLALPISAYTEVKAIDAESVVVVSHGSAVLSLYRYDFTAGTWALVGANFPIAYPLAQIVTCGSRGYFSHGFPSILLVSGVTSSVAPGYIHPFYFDGSTWIEEAAHAMPFSIAHNPVACMPSAHSLFIIDNPYPGAPTVNYYEWNLDFRSLWNRPTAGSLF